MTKHDESGKHVVTVARMATVVAITALAAMAFTSAAWGADESLPAMGNDSSQSVRDRGFFGTVGHYLANNSYFGIGVLHFQYLGQSNDLQIGGRARELLGRSEVPSGTSQSDATTLAGTIGIYIPYTGNHLALELSVAPPIEFDFQVKGAAQEIGGGQVANGGINQALVSGIFGGPIGEDIGTFKALPPNFTLVYRPWTETMIQPYIGAGAMWLYTYDIDVSNPRFARAAKALNATPATLDLSQPVACIAQAGVDLRLPTGLFFRFDARYVGCATVEADLELGTIKSGPQAGTSLGTIETENEFEAILYQLSVGMYF